MKSVRRSLSVSPGDLGQATVSLRRGSSTYATVDVVVYILREEADNDLMTELIDF